MRQVRFVPTEGDRFDGGQVSDGDVEITWAKDLEEMRRMFSACISDSGRAASLCLRDAQSGFSFKIQFSDSQIFHKVRLSDLLTVDRGLPRSVRLILAVELAQAVLTYHETGLIAESLEQDCIWFATTDHNVFRLDDLLLPLHLDSGFLRAREHADDTFRGRPYCGEELYRVSTMLGVTLVEVLLLQKPPRQRRSTRTYMLIHSDMALSDVLTEWGQDCYDATRTCQLGAFGHSHGPVQHRRFLEGVLLPLQATLDQLEPAGIDEKKNLVLGRIPDRIGHTSSEKLFPDEIADGSMKALVLQEHAALESVKDYVRLIMQGCASISWLDDKFSAESINH